MRRKRDRKGDQSLRRAFVSLPDGIWKILDKDFKGKMGEGDSDVIRNMIVAYLSDRGYFITNKGKNSTTDIYDRLFILENMIASLVEMLEEKKALRQSEWEDKTHHKIDESRSRMDKI